MTLLMKRAKKGPRGIPPRIDAYLAFATAAQTYTAYKPPIGAVWAFSSQAYGATLEAGGIRFPEAGAYLLGARVAFANGSGNIGVGFVRNGAVITQFRMQANVSVSPIHASAYFAVTAGDLWAPALYCSATGKTPSVGDTTTSVRLWAVRTD